jgi:hypothetical protein
MVVGKPQDAHIEGQGAPEQEVVQEGRNPPRCGLEGRGIKVTNGSLVTFLAQSAIMTSISLRQGPRDGFGSVPHRVCC